MMSFELPLFPLNVVLFPGMPLPLHVFEPRYKLMMARLLESDRTFGVALLIAGREGQSGTMPAPVGCTARIGEVARFADGRLNLQSEGKRRFHILSLRQEDAYLVGRVEWLDDEPMQAAQATQSRTLSAQVRSALRRYLQGAAPQSRQAVDEMEMPRDAAELSHWAAMLLLAPNAQKQELLEQTSLVARLQMELALLARAQVVQQAFARRLSWTSNETSNERSSEANQASSDDPDSNAALLWLN